MTSARRPRTLSQKTRQVPPKRNGTTGTGNGHRRRAARAGEEHIRRIFNAVQHPMLVFDDQGKYRAANPAAGELLGLPPDAIVGRRIGDFTLPAAEANLGNVWQIFFEEGNFRAESLLQSG